MNKNKNSYRFKRGYNNKAQYNYISIKTSPNLILIEVEYYCYIELWCLIESRVFVFRNG